MRQRQSGQRHLLLRHFIPGPILVQPDPSHQFILEVDALKTGVGALLALLWPEAALPSAFYSHHHTPHNYNNPGLLAVNWPLKNGE